MHKETEFTIVICALAAAAVSAAQIDSFTPPPFSQYKPIIERMPFGEMPDNFGLSVDPDVAKQDALLMLEQKKLAQKVNMSAVNITPQGDTAIGFTDLSSRPPVNYYLLVGAESGGWKVNSANYEEEIAEIEKDGIAISLKLGKGLVEKAAVSLTKSISHSRSLHSARSALTKSSNIRSRLKPPSVSPSINSRSKSSTADAIRKKLRKTRSSANSNELRSYTDRLRDRKLQELQSMKLAKDKERKQLEKLAREVASKEIKKHAAVIADEAKLKKAIALENEIELER